MIVTYKPGIGDMIVTVQELWSQLSKNYRNCWEMIATVEYGRNCQRGGMGWEY